MPAMITAYHVNDGQTLMYDIDARSAVGQHPKEWSLEPWPSKGKTAEKPAAPQGDAAVIPEGWRDLPAADRIALAKTVGAKGNIGAAKADAAIEEYLAAHPATSSAE